MNKKIIIAIASAVVLAGGGITAYALLNQNGEHPAYGTYCGADFNSAQSCIELDENNITFTNVDFSGAEKMEAMAIAFQQVQKNKDNPAIDPENNTVDALYEDIQATLDYDAAFNGKTFEAKEYEANELGNLSLTVYDEEHDYELYLEFFKDTNTISCGNVMYEYKE